YDPVKVGGPLLDLHVHDAHLIRLLFGMPESVTCQGRRRGKVAEYCQTMFGFQDRSLVVGAASGVINQQGRAFTHGFEIHLERATLQYEFAVIGGQGKLLLGDGDPVRAFVEEIAEIVRSLESNRPSPILSGDLARDAVALCRMQEEAVLRGNPV